MTDDLMSEMNVVTSPDQYITVMGVGGAGGNAVNHMYNLGIRGVNFVVCNTDAQALSQSPVEDKIQIGEGLGAGNDPEKGRLAAVESLDKIRQYFLSTGSRMVFITAGMGGGTGTGASPVIAKLAKEMGLLTVGIVTSPLAVEGNLRYEQAFKGIELLRQNVDSLLIIDNEHILEMFGKLSLRQAFGRADDILASAAKGIAEIITIKSDLVNVDFADVSKVLKDSGHAHMAVATATGEHRAIEAAEATLKSPLLNHTEITGAKDILINFAVSDADTLLSEEVMEALEYIQAHASVQSEDGKVQSANIIWGTSEKPELESALEMMIVATGFPSEQNDKVMRRIIPPMRKRDAVQQPKSNSVLEPAKPKMPQVPAEQVVLGKKTTRYKDIEERISHPAYKVRNAKFIVDISGSRKEVVRDEIAPAEPKKAESASLFAAIEPEEKN